MTNTGRSRYFEPIQKGDLVKVNVVPGVEVPEDSLLTGVVLDVWPANVYEHSESVVLIGGDTRPNRIVVRTSYLTRLEDP